MESVDTEYYNSLQWIRENDPTELELAFQVTILQELELAGNFRASVSGNYPTGARASTSRYVSFPIRAGAGVPGTVTILQELELTFQVTTGIPQELELAGNFPARAGAGVTGNYIYHGVFSVGKKEKN